MRGAVEEEKTFQKFRENERALRKKIILDSALSLFEKKTFTKTSMADIAREVGVSTSTLYGYFPSQEELFLEAFLHDLSHLDQILEENVIAAGGNTDQQALEALADRMLSHLMNSEATFQMISLLITEANMPEHLLTKFNDFRNELYDRVTRVLRMSGVNEPDLTTSRAFFASVLGAIMFFRNHPQEENENRNETVRKLVRYIVDVFKAGIPLVGGTAAR
ncbi:hypothetical protein JCM14469_30820 [Desulfatiferula olefinivorans]